MYFWGTPDASVSFCETAYTHSTWIAEYYNTMSSCLYFFVGYLFLNTNIHPLAVGVMCIGAGSIMLHGTLRYYGQWADELAMLTTSFYGLRYQRPYVRHEWIYLLFVFYLSFYNYFIIFFLSISAINIYFGVEALKSSEDQILYRLYVFFFGLASLCWLLDKFVCNYVQQYYLHAWWHVFTSLGLWNVMYALQRSHYRKIKDEKTP